VTVAVVLATLGSKSSFVPSSDADDKRTVTCSGDRQPASRRSSDV